MNIKLGAQAQAVPNGDRICGKWISTDKNLIVEVYKAGDRFKAKIVWFYDDPGKPMNEWRDTKNPDPSLRTRRILGMNVVDGLKYDAGNDSWEGGTIYDAKSGKEWDAAAYINKQGLLKVKGYWHFKLLGRTMTFKRT